MTVTTTHDAIVVGAGPAGLHCAALLAAEGFDVVVLEEHAAVGLPVHCTGVVSGEIEQLYKVPDAMVLNRPTRCRLIAPGGHGAELTTSSEEIVVLDRSAFDHSLADAAQRAGARVVTGQRAADVLPDARGVRVRTDGGDEWRGRCAVIAAGVTYRFHAIVGSRAPDVLHTAQLELDALPADSLEIHVGSAVAPQGFAWLVPVAAPAGPRVKAGVLLHGDARSHLHAFLARPDVAPRLREVPGEPVRRLLPVGPVRRSYGARVIAVGDAAGLTKPVTGGGIFYSMLSATFAAEVLADALHRDDLGAERLAAYERLWRTRLGPDLRVGAWFRRLLVKLTDAEWDCFVEAVSSDDVKAVIAQTARFNWHRAVILAVLRRPGIKSIVLRSLFR